MTGSVGFFGKLPGVGDFVQRRLPSAFISVWDANFEAAVAGARSALGETWREAWQAAPCWRFALAPGVCGASAWVGVMGPSADRVGRGFPMVLACAVGATSDWIRSVREGASWFAELERVHRGVGTNTSAAAFDAAVQALPDAPGWLDEIQASQRTAVDWAQGGVCRMPWRPAGAEPALAAWASVCAEAGDGCLWWMQGDTGMSSRALLTRGLPGAETYVDFLVAGATLQRASITVGRADPEPLTASLSGNRDSLLDDLLSEPTMPAAVAAVTAPVATSTLSVAGTAAVAAAALDPLPAPTPTGVVAHTHGCCNATSWVAADNGPVDPRRQAAIRAEQALAAFDAWHDTDAIRARLLALHAPLRERREDLIDPVAEDGAVIVAHVDADSAAWVRVGAAAAWHWRRGQLRPVFAEARVATDRDDTVRRGDLGALLSTPSDTPGAGLGAASEPHCEVATCLVASGDRLVLLATDTLTRLSAETLAASLAGATSEEACSRIAMAAGLGADRAHWPLAVIEVGT